MDDKEQEDLREIEERARELLKKKVYAEALALCQEAESRGLSSPVIYARHASALAGLKRWPEAAALLEEKLKEYPSEPSLYTAKAFLSLKQKKPTDALAACDYAASIGVWDGKLAANKAVALHLLRKNKEAVSLLEEELEKYPNEASLHFNLGLAYHSLGKKVEAEREVEIAVAADPTLADIAKKAKTLWKLTNPLIKALQPSVYFAFFAVLLGFLFWPSVSYYFAPFWVIFFLLFALILLFSLSTRHFKDVAPALFGVLLFGALAYFSIFHLPVHIKMDMPFGIRLFLASFIALEVVILWAVRRRRASKMAKV